MSTSSTSYPTFTSVEEECAYWKQQAQLYKQRYGEIQSADSSQVQDQFTSDSSLKEQKFYRNQVATVTTKDGQTVEVFIKTDADSESNYNEAEEQEEYSNKNNNEILKEEFSDDAVYDEDGLSLEQKRFRCSLCRYSTDRAHDLCRHQRVHENPQRKNRYESDVVFECDKCEYKTFYPTNLRRHKRIHTGKVKSVVYECKACDFQTKSAQQLKAHKRVTHALDRYHPCDECQYSTPRLGDLRRHKKSHDNKRARAARKRLFRCGKCEYTTQNGGNFKKHELTHMTSYPCDQCDVTSSSLRAHLMHARTHSGRQVAQCEQCDYVALYASQLERHRLTHGSAPRSHLCDECGFATTGRYLLACHKRRHTGDKPYKCDLCDYAASQSNHLAQHRRSRHTGERQYHMCDECGAALRSAAGLRIHRRARHSMEKPYQCEVCEYRTAYPFVMRKHVQHVHMSDKPHRCSQCEYATTAASALVRHTIRYHSVSNPYRCHVCGFTTTERIYLIRHQQRNHQYVNTYH